MPRYIFFITFFCLLLNACNQPPSSTTAHAKKNMAHLVKTTIVNPQSLTTKVVYTGSLRARHVVRIFNQEEGRVTHLPYYEGDTVKANAQLVRIDDVLLKVELDKTIAIHKQTRINVQRLRKLAKKHLISADELLRAQTEQDIALAEEEILRTRLSYTKIKAPFRGIVTARLVEPGDVISKNTHVLTVIDPNSLIIDVDVSEYILSKLKNKYPVSVQIDALGIKTFKGKISRIHPTIDLQTRFGRIEIALQKLPRGVKEGQFCRVIIKNQLSKRLTLPYAALRRDREGEYVFLVDVDNKVQRQSVQSGQRLADRVEIRKGIKKGQKIVTKGFLGLQAGKKVQQVE
jgi:RND family efflux transporter MFP subunit